MEVLPFFRNKNFKIFKVIFLVLSYVVGLHKKENGGGKVLKILWWSLWNDCSNMGWMTYTPIIWSSFIDHIKYRTRSDCVPAMHRFDLLLWAFDHIISLISSPYSFFTFITSSLLIFPLLSNLSQKVTGIPFLWFREKWVGGGNAFIQDFWWFNLW